MTSRRPSTSSIAIGLVLLAFALRLAWLGDMEWKGDEKATAELVAGLPWFPVSPLAAVSTHSGIAHSSLVHTFMKWLSLGARDPRAIVAGIAVFNAFAAALPLWLLRRSPRQRLAFAACATSVTLIVHSRKIWSPDLVAAWSMLAIGSLAWGLEQASPRRRCLGVGLAGFCLVLAGHMYLPGMLIAAAAGAAGFWSLHARHPRPLARAWLAGGVAGWLTFVPYLYSLCTRPAEALAATSGAAKVYEWDQVWRIFREWAVLPAPGTIAARYVRTNLAWLNEHHPGPLLCLTVFFLAAALGAWLAIYWAALLRTARNWRQVPEDPLAACAVGVLFALPVALFSVRLGSYLHYWLGAIPFVYSLISWAVGLQPGSRSSRLLTRASWIACGLSALAMLLLELLVHRAGGLPEEYGTAYGAQLVSRPEIEHK